MRAYQQCGVACFLVSSTNLPAVEIRSDSATRYADLASIQNDLKMAVGACSVLIDRLSTQGEHDLVVEGALWCQVVMRYMRCFSTGNRLQLSASDVAALESSLVGASGLHQQLDDARNKQIGHRVGPLEQLNVGAILSHEFDEGPDAPVVVGIADLHGQLNTPATEAVVAVRLLAERLRSSLEPQAEAARSAALAEAQARPIAEFRLLPRLQLTVPTPAQARRTHDKMRRV